MIQSPHKVAVIAGGASGMGAATAKWLAANGMKVAVLDQQKEAAEKLAREINGIAIATDVTQDSSVKNAIAEVMEKWQAIHVCVNCAGVAPAARIVGKNGPMPLEDFQRVIQINLIGTFNVMRYAAARMIQQEPLDTDGQRGVIINTASIAAFEGQIGQAAYSASKGGIVSLTLPAAREFSQFGVRVMTIAPGVVHTPLMANMTEEVAANLGAAVPFPKRMGNAEEYARLVQHIVENPYLNGSVIRLDGALRMTMK